jgi:hypothetical protein
MVMIVAHGWALATTSVTMPAQDQPHQIVIAVLLMPMKTMTEHAYVMTDTEVKDVPSGSDLATQSAMAATEPPTPNVTSVLITQLRMNMEIVTVIGSGRVLPVTNSYTRDLVTQSVTGIKDVLVQQPPTVMPVTSTLSRITTIPVNVKLTGLVKTVEHTYSQDIATLFVTVIASAPPPPTVYNAYHILIVIATQLVSVTISGLEMTVAYVSTWKHVIQFVTIVMAVLAQLVRTVLLATTTLSVTSKDTVNVKKDSMEMIVTHSLAHVIQCADVMSIATDTT